MSKIFILLGLPGSGKGTQGAMLSSKLRIPHISTGDIFRNIIKTNTEEAQIVRSYMEAGKLIPSHMVNKIVRGYILSDECKGGCILDGYPRTLAQAEFFVENISANIAAILFDVPSDVIIKRILGRFSCNNCGKLYNDYYYKPLRDNICDVCDSDDFSRRVDDDERTIKQRLEEYKKETLPLVDYYASKKKLYKINAKADKDEIFKELVKLAKNI